MASAATILVVDDEAGVRESFKMVLKEYYTVLVAADGQEAFTTFNKNSIDLILLDILLPGIGGLELLTRFKQTDPNIEVIMVTAVKEIHTAVQAIKAGAYEYIIKPFNVDEVLTTIERALEKRSLIQEVTYLRNELQRYRPFEEIVGRDPKMRAVFDLIDTVSGSDGTVLIQGESGTGKELVARAVHKRSPRRDKPFVVINCAAIPATLMESEIFGHTQGAFTGATRASIGKLEIAHRGTVFLDDIDSLEISMQAKLLRVIQEKEFERLGSTKVIKVDVRFVAASNKDLRRLIADGGFRQDLYYRLDVLPIHLPPLRERRSDIPLLLQHFVQLHCRNSGAAPKQFSTRAVNALVNYSWPGNVRELQNLVERLVTVVRRPLIRRRDLNTLFSEKSTLSEIPLKDAIRKFEKRCIAEALELNDDNRSAAAKMLGIHRNTLLLKIRELGLKKKKPPS